MKYLEVIEDLDGWTFPLRGERVVRVTADHRVTFHSDGGSTIGIQGPFTVVHGGTGDDLDARRPAELGPALGILQCVVDHARASWDGLLRLAFSGGDELFVQPSDQVEAWFVGFPDGRLYLSEAGGGITALPSHRG